MSFLPGVHETLGHVSTESRSVLYTGIVLYSTDDPEADAVLVSDGMIAWTGSQDTARLIHDDAEVVDATGCLLTPGFVDAAATADGSAPDPQGAAEEIGRAHACTPVTW